MTPVTFLVTERLELNIVALDTQKTRYKFEGIDWLLKMYLLKQFLPY
jgi:hypothetical protein